MDQASNHIIGILMNEIEKQLSHFSEISEEEPTASGRSDIWRSCCIVPSERLKKIMERA